MDDALRAAVDDAVRFGLCLVERPGALDRLGVLTGGQTAFADAGHASANDYDFSHTPPDYVAHDLAQYHPALEHELPEVLLPSIEIWQKEIQHVT